MKTCFPILLLTICTTIAASSVPVSYSGIYPHLAFFNEEDECGTGAVVPWADRLWAITYAPHAPTGSTDKLYEITPDLELIIRNESIGGTPANRMIHRESQQLFIGPYAINGEGEVRTIPYSQMFGRPTGNARHLTDPANRIYFASMEAGIYDVDVHTLEVATLYHDMDAEGEPKAGLPGYHGKGLYSGQGRLVYANNGERSVEAHRNAFIPSGVLAEWNGRDWAIVRRNQFTEVTGPGGIYGNKNPDTDPIWSIGWDARSLILMVLDKGKWHRFRLPKASHSYDGAHGWNTEWPRIRDIGEEHLLMTMHGMFWKFPRDFSAANTAGLVPRSTYLKVVGDFAHWQGRIAFGCDDTARREFLNTRQIKGEIAPSQSQSNLWFVEPEKVDRLGAVIGRGAVWLEDAVGAGEVSDPFLFSGFTRRAVHLVSDAPVTYILEADRVGDGNWEQIAEIETDGYRWYAFDAGLEAQWIRVRSKEAVEKATVWFHYAGPSPHPRGKVPAKFDGVARVGDKNVRGGIIRAKSDGSGTLEFAAAGTDGKTGYYILDEKMQLKRSKNSKRWNWLQEHAGIPSTEGRLMVEEASVLYIDDTGRRFRLPKGQGFSDEGALGAERVCREIVTERDLFNFNGTFYELPAKNAGGFACIRPVSTHSLRVSDYCGFRGLLVVSGVNQNLSDDNPHIIRSDDGEVSLWVGAIDDLWELGKPVGTGGPWLNSEVSADIPSDPYLMTGYDRKILRLNAKNNIEIRVEVDISGRGDWYTYKTFEAGPDNAVSYEFPTAFQAYWVRFVANESSVASAQLEYE